MDVLFILIMKQAVYINSYIYLHLLIKLSTPLTFVVDITQATLINCCFSRCHQYHDFRFLVSIHFTLRWCQMLTYILLQIAFREQQWLLGFPWYLQAKRTEINHSYGRNSCLTIIRMVYGSYFVNTCYDYLTHWYIISIIKLCPTANCINCTF